MFPLWADESMLLEDFLHSPKGSMTCIQTYTIKDGGIILTLAMKQGNIITNNSNLDHFHNNNHQPLISVSLLRILLSHLQLIHSNFNKRPRLAFKIWRIK